ncbi:penicillin-binding transpeptidase domain-containing protein [Streptomyces sp. SL13]|uniref:Penicillin-binding transpeptidase domain-containing protein n=1 Tax=Streptantibioticus silvisoli TaxID=2705255 RepID=A0AA90GWX7_9ACTN|nr:penicillin-binding transpeptidase domain-containing protein [Streptantibioticus silvisoli]MDI5969399.1 penicillin-binding transpeptidase domain-containing protein [Streptantibioticus silvisoli]
MHISRRATALATTAVVIIGGAAFGCHALTGGSGNDVTHTADTFLSAWQAGDLDTAAGLTTSPDEAKTELLAYRNETGVTSVHLVPGHVHGNAVDFTATARIHYSGVSANWTYASHLVVTSTATGDARVAWHSSVIHPELPDGGGYTLQPSTEPATAVITDRHGTPLDARTHPGLQGVLDELRERQHGSGGLALAIRISSEGNGGGGRVVATLDEGKSIRVTTRLDASVQKAVDTVAAAHPGSSVVVIRPSTGDVLATSTPGGTDFNPTLEGVQAPGQIFELVTAAALLDHGAVTPATNVGCPATATVAGRTFTDPGGWTSQDASFKDVFSHACDTGYVRLAARLSGQELADEADGTFGLGRDWHTGVTTADGAVPVLAGGDKAAAFVGQGEIRLNTLNLASLTATIESGSFKQPLFVDSTTVGASPARTSRPLPAGVAANLQALMRAYAGENGADGAAFGGVADQFSDSDVPIVGWYTAFQGDLAVAATAPEQGHHPQVAGAVVQAILRATAS